MESRKAGRKRENNHYHQEESVTNKKLFGEVPKCVFLRQKVVGEVPECVFLMEGLCRLCSRTSEEPWSTGA
jgi:hypothetical protein